MKRARHAGLLAAIALASASHGDPTQIDPVSAATPQVVDALTGLDFPARQNEMTAQRGELDLLLGADPVASLTAIANADTQVAAGVRVRAIRALALYAQDDARAALRDLIAKHALASTGLEILELRAAIEALGIVGDTTDVARIVPFLDKEESRDVRAAAARALRDLGSTTAIAPLHARLAKEKAPQVQFWISDALRVLSGTSQ